MWREYNSSSSGGVEGSHTEQPSNAPGCVTPKFYSVVLLLLVSVHVCMFWELLQQHKVGTDLEVGLAIPEFGSDTTVLRTRSGEHALLDAGRDHLQAVRLYRPRPRRGKRRLRFRPTGHLSGAHRAHTARRGRSRCVESWSYRGHERRGRPHGCAEKDSLQHLGLLTSAVALGVTSCHVGRWLSSRLQCALLRVATRLQRCDRTARAMR